MRLAIKSESRVRPACMRSLAQAHQGSRAGHQGSSWAKRGEARARDAFQDKIVTGAGGQQGKANGCAHVVFGGDRCRGRPVGTCARRWVVGLRRVKVGSSARGRKQQATPRRGHSFGTLVISSPSKTPKAAKQRSSTQQTCAQSSPAVSPRLASKTPTA